MELLLRESRLHAKALEGVGFCCGNAQEVGLEVVIVSEKSVGINRCERFFKIYQKR
jgi:hypothetical protein